MFHFSSCLKLGVILNHLLCCCIPSPQNIPSFYPIPFLVSLRIPTRPAVPDRNFPLESDVVVVIDWNPDGKLQRGRCQRNLGMLVGFRLSLSGGRCLCKPLSGLFQVSNSSQSSAKNEICLHLKVKTRIGYN